MNWPTLRDRVQDPSSDGPQIRILGADSVVDQTPKDRGDGAENTRRSLGNETGFAIVPEQNLLALRLEHLVVVTPLVGQDLTQLLTYAS